MRTDTGDLKHAMDVTVRERVNALSLKTYEELARLPSQSSEDLILQGNKITLSVWHDVLSSQDHRIVVQAYKPGKFGVGRMHADGFVVNDRNEKRALTLEEWAPFS